MYKVYENITAKVKNNYKDAYSLSKNIGIYNSVDFNKLINLINKKLKRSQKIKDDDFNNNQLLGFIDKNREDISELSLKELSNYIISYVLKNPENGLKNLKSKSFKQLASEVIDPDSKKNLIDTSESLIKVKGSYYLIKTMFENSEPYAVEVYNSSENKITFGKPLYTQEVKNPEINYHNMVISLIKRGKISLN
jgi:hypothetical protein